MATLTETAYYSRKVIKYGAISLVVFLILRLIFGIILGYIGALIPNNPKANNAFNKLSAISFPKSASPSAEITFTLQTIDGTIPAATETARVYFMPKGRSNLLSLSKAQSMVDKLGFTTSPRQLTDTLYRWVDLRSPLRNIEMDVISSHFSLNYLYQHDLTLFQERNIPAPQEARQEAMRFFQNIGVSMNDIDQANPTVLYLKLVGNQLEPASSQSQADAVKIDFFRLSLEGKRAVTDKPGEGNITIVLSGSRRSDQRVLYAKYQSWPIDQNYTGLYKLKTASEAWTEFLAGKAYIAELPENVTQIAVTNISVAYYDGSISQYYYQPVFVIEGEKFVAYVSAVAPPWTE